MWVVNKTFQIQYVSDGFGTKVGVRASEKGLV